MGFWDDKRPPKENFASKDDIRKLQKDVGELLKDKDQPDTRGATRKLIGSLSQGFGDIAKSLSTSENKKRMRIAQMPGKKAPIGRIGDVHNPIAGKNAGMRRHHISNAPLD